MEAACFCYTLSYQFIKQSIAVNYKSSAIIGVLSKLKTRVIVSNVEYAVFSSDCGSWLTSAL